MSDTTFNLTRKEFSTSRPFNEVVAAIEAGALVVVPEANHAFLGPDIMDALASHSIDAAELTRRISERVGSPHWTRS
jgi:hypothetical protein